MPMRINPVFPTQCCLGSARGTPARGGSQHRRAALWRSGRARAHWRAPCPRGSAPHTAPRPLRSSPGTAAPLPAKPPGSVPAASQSSPHHVMNILHILLLNPAARPTTQSGSSWKITTTLDWDLTHPPATKPGACRHRQCNKSNCYQRCIMWVVLQLLRTRGWPTLSQQHCQIHVGFMVW